MKKNGCKLMGAVFKCEPRDCKHYNKQVKYRTNCEHEKILSDYNDTLEVGCTNRAAQREAMKPKTRWTTKEPVKDGWYWIKEVKQIALYACGWHLVGLNEPFTHEDFLKQGYKRSVKPIEED